MSDIVRTILRVWGVGCPSCKQEYVFRYGPDTEQCFCQRCKHEFDLSEAKEIN